MCGKDTSGLSKSAKAAVTLIGISCWGGGGHDLSRVRVILCMLRRRKHEVWLWFMACFHSVAYPWGWRPSVEV